MQNTNSNFLSEIYFALAVHDLKTPVNAQILATEFLLQQKDLDPNSSEMITDILDSARYLKTLIDNLLTKYQLEINSINIRIEPNSILDVINDAKNGLKYLFEEKNIKFELQNELINPTQNFDYIEIKRVFNNLLSNAIEYSPQGSKIILKTVENKNEIIFYIKDFGKGIDLKNPSDIFKKDLTLAKSQKKLGTGLGLFISKQIVEAHKGTINVKTKLNKGTTIYFSLPKNL